METARTELNPILKNPENPVYVVFVNLRVASWEKIFLYFSLSHRVSYYANRKAIRLSNLPKYPKESHERNDYLPGWRRRHCHADH